MRRDDFFQKKSSLYDAPNNKEKCARPRKIVSVFMMASTLYRFHFPSSSCYTGGIKQAHYLYRRTAGIARHAFMLYNGET